MSEDLNVNNIVKGDNPATTVISNKRTISSREMVMAAMMTAVLAVLSQISIPLPTGIPITLQTFAVALCGFLLGWKMSCSSVGVFLLIGAVGIPVFSNFTGGIGKLAGVTGGFLWGFLLMAFFCGLSVKRKYLVTKILLGIAGMMLCHLIGCLQFSIVAKTGIVQAFLIASAPYLIKDIVSVCVAYYAAYILRKRIHL